MIKFLMTVTALSMTASAADAGCLGRSVARSRTVTTTKATTVLTPKTVAVEKMVMVPTKVTTTETVLVPTPGPVVTETKVKARGRILGIVPCPNCK